MYLQHPFVSHSEAGRGKTTKSMKAECGINRHQPDGCQLVKRLIAEKQRRIGRKENRDEGTTTARIKAKNRKTPTFF